MVGQVLINFLFGGEGNDFLGGGYYGYNTLTGGAGADNFAIPEESTGIDITDFSVVDVSITSISCG